jgi:succinate dehydrogenase/fumarate reductase flavoprotein subunit
MKIMQRIVKFESIHSFDLHTDIVVVGSGGAGANAVLEAHWAGLEIIVL